MVRIDWESFEVSYLFFESDVFEMQGIIIVNIENKIKNVHEHSFYFKK